MRPALILLMLAGCGFQVSGGTGDAATPPQDGTTDETSDATFDATTDADTTSRDAMPATITYVQNVTSTGSGAMGTTLFAVGLPQPVVAGDTCIVGVGMQSGTITSVADSSNNTYTNVLDANGNHIYVAANMNASANNSVSITFNGTSGYVAAIAVYRGLATVTPVEDHSTGTGTGTSMDAGEVQTVHPHDLLVGFAASTGTLAAGAGMTARTNTTYVLVEDREVTTAGNYHALATSNATVMWAMSVLALKAAD